MNTEKGLSPMETHHHALLIVLLLLLTPVQTLGAQTREIIKRQQRLDSECVEGAGCAAFVEGYAATIRGELINYHSVRDDCTAALLTRATDGEMPIEWTTAPVPADRAAGGAVFFWLSGADLTGVEQSFFVFVNGHFRFEFRSSQKEEWAVDGLDGGRLAFSVFSRDQHGDGFGYMRLHAPTEWLTPGEPLTIKIVGQNGGSPTWFMVFECSDALAHFRAKCATEAWCDLTLQPRGDHQTMTIAAPLSWVDRTVSYTIGSAIRGTGRLAVRDGEVFASFRIPGSRDAIEGLFVGVAVDRKAVVGGVALFSESESSRIRPDHVVYYRGAHGDGGTWRLETDIVFKPHLSQGLGDLARTLPSQGAIHLISSSHQDIAWMDSPAQCIEDRDRAVITPALELLGRSPEFCFDMEDILCLREYLERHPEAKDEIASYAAEGRLTWGAAYTAPYEEMYSGEALARQFYLGRKWFRKEFPGLDTDTYWNVDVPGRTLQMAQILSKAGVTKMIISRHAAGLFRWLSPDGSGVDVYSPGHYGNSIGHLRKEPLDAAAHLSALARQWMADEPSCAAAPVVPLLADSDMAGPLLYTEFVSWWNRLDRIESTTGEDLPLSLPELTYSTATRYMDAALPEGVTLPTICGERPAVWLYIHGPSHHKALTAGRESSVRLTQAEKFCTIEALLARSFDEYPNKALTEAWEAAIYPDHGWGGHNGTITDLLFLEKFECARDEAEDLRDKALEAIAARVKARPEAGTPLIVFNSLSWERSDPVEFSATFGKGKFSRVAVFDSSGVPVDSQVTVNETHPDGSAKSVEIALVAEGVPPVGYKTFYLRNDPDRVDSNGRRALPGSIETDHYSIVLAPGGIGQIRDKALGVDLLATEKFLGAELFTMQSEGNGAGEFADVQQPTMEGFDTLSAHEPLWKLVEAGPVRTILQMEQQIAHARVQQKLIAYNALRRIDIHTALSGWDGTAFREFRLAFPIAMDEGQVAYEVPFGTVEVGRDEIDGAAGERYITECSAVRPRGIGDWIGVSNGAFGVTLASSVAVCDYADPTVDPLASPMLQPILLASRRSCHGLGPLYNQAGDHSFRFSLFSHEPGWERGYKQAKQANEPLIALLAPTAVRVSLPEEHSFFSVGAPNIVISTIKKCEDSDGVVVRLYDAEGKDTSTALRLFTPIQTAFRTDLIEEEPVEIPCNEHSVSIDLGHHAVETLLLH